ncbi:VWA domain-containing protein [Azoarcus olearius]|uniref:Conserved hypothetical membrane protein n=1 Tax=Azoarcus sp. (strain BH72) TaxID=418699 RepID=A1K9H1_AZOSB|nr:VWA domain-containing protein [Azoarcus olearius]ANQ86027.1 hypothetical protein dqs_2999 [Azoarcus olearius]CAL95476.1 conserved hypothetical membrane protein [Azoarcus olearius]
MIGFAWPELLWLLLILPLLVVFYLVLWRRHRAEVMRYAGLDMVRAALAARRPLRRHVPPLIYLLGLAAMLVAVARPSALVTLPVTDQTILLAMDISGSMRATDIAPNRLAAAQAAARSFVEVLPSDTRVGVVAFAATAALIQAPTRNHDDVLAAIDRVQLQRGTAIGSGMVLSLATLLPEAGIDLRLLAGDGSPPADKPPPGEPTHAPVPPGSHAYGAIVLLTDGERTTGPPLDFATRLAADHGVRVYTVGVGTAEGGVVGYEGWSMRVRLDEAALKSIADETRGEYFHAQSAEALRTIYRKLGTRLTLQERKTEVSALFAAAGAALMVLAAGLSMVWFRRIL